MCLLGNIVGLESSLVSGAIEKVIQFYIYMFFCSYEFLKKNFHPFYCIWQTGNVSFVIFLIAPCTLTNN